MKMATSTWFFCTTKCVKSLPICCSKFKFTQLGSYKFFSEFTKKKYPQFIDMLQIQACGGAGGQGLPKYGGYGGDGGKVIFVVNKKVKSLRQVLQKYPNQVCRAEAGGNSDRFCLLGERGADLHVEVPVGVLVHKADGEIADLNEDGDICQAAEGGMGGNKRTNFLGLRGERNVVSLELKLLADVGLVGFPNAGKSTFLRTISAAKPKVAAYPFTTLSPQLGMMQYEDGRMISVADLPGLIEGAHENFGMGFKFLRHVERTKVLLYVLDINPFQLSLQYPMRSAFETLLLLIQELSEYGNGMINKPSVLVLNKVDTDPSQAKVNQLLDLVNNLPDSLDQVNKQFHPAELPVFDDILTMSAMKKVNVLSVKNRLREVMDDYAEKRRAEEIEKKKSLLTSEKISIHEEHLKSTLV
ncbi:GTP-binding protein 10 homolog [Physella acuta]|uniref:GTP-binding protein 10 homolog n=1 Tax=Physella acuta TaxID=109671 RepID=UPI0027DCE1DA|nr:GTP-binding protein 10 homolog [Physella acuta]